MYQTSGDFTITLPAGKWQIAIEHGNEYIPVREEFELQKNEKEKEKLQREGDNKVKQALEKQGLTPQSYNRLFVAVNNSQQLRQKTLALISEERKKS